VRLVGLAGLARPAAGAGLLLPRCRCVHTLGMRFRIDVVFLSPLPAGFGRAVVLELRERLPPGRVALLGRGRKPRSRRDVLAAELPSGEASVLGLREGTEVRLRPVQAPVTSAEGDARSTLPG
jgi:uncharacterized protein